MTDHPLLTEITSNLCCQCPHERVRVVRAVSTPACRFTDRHCAPDSDSEGENESSCCWRRRLCAFKISRRRGRRRDELEPRNNGALLRVRIRGYSACIFAD